MNAGVIEAKKSRRRSKFAFVKVLITGAANGLGKSLALEFARKGACLMLWDIDEKGLKDTALQCKQLGCAQMKVEKVDLTSLCEIQKAAKAINKEYDGIDILINNAGIFVWKYLTDTSDQEITKMIDVNLMAHIWVVRSFLAKMLERNSGQIVSICSVASIAAAPRLIPYATSKYAAYGFSEGLRNEFAALGKTGITVTTICPHWIDTGLIRGVRYHFTSLK